MFLVQQKGLEDLQSRVQFLCSKAVEEDGAAIKKMQEIWKSFMSKSNSLKSETEGSAERK